MVQRLRSGGKIKMCVWCFWKEAGLDFPDAFPSSVSSPEVWLLCQTKQLEINVCALDKDWSSSRSAGRSVWVALIQSSGARSSKLIFRMLTEFQALASVAASNVWPLVDWYSLMCTHIHANLLHVAVQKIWKGVWFNVSPGRRFLQDDQEQQRSQHALLRW